MSNLLLAAAHAESAAGISALGSGPLTHCPICEPAPLSILWFAEYARDIFACLKRELRRARLPSASAAKLAR